MRSTFCSFLAIPLLIATPTMAQFSDVYEGFHYSEAIEYAKTNNIVSGYSDGSFKPKNKINRAEFTKIIVEATTSQNEITGSNCFPDVKNEWFAKYICTAKNKGFINGFKDGSFKPEQNISFVEASKIISLAFGDTITPDSTEWYKPYILNLETKKAIPSSILSLEYAINRQDMVEIIWRVKTKPEKETVGFQGLKLVNISDTEAGKGSIEFTTNGKTWGISDCLADEMMNAEELGMGEGEFCPHIIEFSFPQVIGDFIILRASHRTFMQGELMDTTGIFLVEQSTGRSTFFTLYGLFNKSLLDRKNLDNKTIFFFDFQNDKIVIKERLLNSKYQYEEIIKNGWKENWFIGIKNNDFYAVNWGYPDKALFNISTETNQSHSISYEDIFKNFDLEDIKR